MGSPPAQPGPPPAPTGHPVGRPGPPVLAATLVALVVLGASLSGPWVVAGRTVSWAVLFGAGGPEDVLPPEQPSAPGVPPVDVDAGPWGTVLLVVVGVLLALLVLLALAVVLRRLWQRLARRAASPDGAGGPTLAVDRLDDTEARALHAAVMAAEQRLDDDLAPGDAVVAAWVDLEHAAALTVERDPAQTPTEFTLAVLGSTSADPAAARVLLDLYLSARFSAHPVTAQDVQRARASLRTLADGLARPAPTDVAGVER